MNLRTTFKIEESLSKINYQTPAMFIGSCFASEIGSKLKEARLAVMINPSGSVYNPVSVANTLGSILRNKKFNQEDLFKYNERYLSFYHYTDFTSEDPFHCLSRINQLTEDAHEFLSKARFLFITFGTARIYKLKETGEIVSNCHKLPNDYFTRHLLSVEEIVGIWNNTFEELKKFNNNLNVIFTVSPVRHWKDGAHGNQVSKSVLFLAIEELLRHSISPQYFPAYELLMDDLRDYRFYADDMLHPSTSAIDYIWESFSECFIEGDAVSVMNEAKKITNGFNHRISDVASTEINNFAEKLLKKISECEARVPSIDFSKERDYFINLLTKKP